MNAKREGGSDGGSAGESREELSRKPGVEGEMIAPCGLNCAACTIYRAKSEPNVMNAILKWFREERKRELAPEKIHCDGCLGDRSRHWSADCGILKCVVDEHGLDSCSRCNEFPCGRLETWAQKDAGYAGALGNLKAMKEMKERKC